MPEVYIDALTINNFGPYYGEHTFEFGTDGRRSATLIGGKNGAGKTHLLRALYLATVGESGAIDLKKVESGSDATRFELAESLNRRARSEGQDTCSLSLRLSQRDDTGSIGRTLNLVRQIRQRPTRRPFSTPRPTSQATRIGLRTTKKSRNSAMHSFRAT